MLLVAEIGLNHDGNFNLIFEMIRSAKFAGADIAKFQFGWREKKNEINYIDLNRAKTLKKWCDYFEIEMMASIINENAFKLAKAINLKRYKIASRTVVENPKLCKKIIAEGKEVFCSLGFWKKKKFPFGKPSKKLRYIFCSSNYPSFPVHLKKMPKDFNEKSFYGYSDHYIGISACLLAISNGANFVEKHFTINKSSQVIRDHVLSATEVEMKILSTYGKEIFRLKNEIKKK